MDQRANLDTASLSMFLDVVVILGDWRLADRSKLERRFGTAEFEAIERLKAALQELSSLQKVL